MTDSRTDVIVVGAVNNDIEAHLQTDGLQGASNPAALRWQLGGVAGNVYRSCNKHVSSLLVTTVGDQSNASAMEESLRAHHIYYRLLPSTGNTGTYIAVLDKDSQLFMGLSDSGAIENISNETLIQDRQQWPTHGYLAFDCNLPSRLIKTLLEVTPTAYTIALPVSPSKALRLKNSIGKIDLLIGNSAEFKALCNETGNIEASALARKTQALGFPTVVMSDADRPLYIVTGRGTERVNIAPVNNRISSVNGAGDALAGATIAGLAMGHTVSKAVTHFGLQAARHVLERGNS